MRALLRRAQDERFWCWRGEVGVPRAGALLDAHDFLGALPQPLEVVVGPLFEREQVRDHRAEVDEHPTAFRLAFLPEGHAGRVGVRIERLDQRAKLPLVVSSSDIEAPPERVWTVMTDVERWPEWTQSVSKVELVRPGPLATGVEARIAQPRLGTRTWRVTAVEAGRGFTWETTGPGTR